MIIALLYIICYSITMLFLSSEQRSRNFVTEQAIGTFQDSLKSPALRQKLGQSLGRFATLAERFYVPNIRHGLVTPPRRHRSSEGIAVIALHTSDKVSVAEHYAKQSLRQQAAIRRQLAEAGLSEQRAMMAAQQIDSLVTDTQGSDSTRITSGIHYGDSVQAETWTIEHPLPIDRSVFPHANSNAVKWSRLGLPTMLIRYGNPDSQISPSLMLHESVHIDQIESEPLQPVFDPRDRHNRDAYMLTTELPAYTMGASGVKARVAEGLNQSDLQRVDRMQLAVEGIRQAICSTDDPFDSAARHTDTILNALEKIDVS